MTVVKYFRQNADVTRNYSNKGRYVTWKSGFSHSPGRSHPPLHLYRSHLAAHHLALPGLWKPMEGQVLKTSKAISEGLRRRGRAPTTTTPENQA